VLHSQLCLSYADYTTEKYLITQTGLSVSKFYYYKLIITAKFFIGRETRVASLCYFLITRPKLTNAVFMFIFLFCMFIFYSAYSGFLYFLCIFSPFVYSCLYIIFVQVYWQLPPGGNPVAFNKYQSYHIISYIISYHIIIIIIYIIYHNISYHISHHIISYRILYIKSYHIMSCRLVMSYHTIHIIPYHIISYHVIYF
jgi:hypothetical protein